jgi:hypothetical protein
MGVGAMYRFLSRTAAGILLTHGNFLDAPYLVGRSSRLPRANSKEQAKGSPQTFSIWTAGVIDIADTCCRRLEHASLSVMEASPPGVASSGVPLPPLLDSPPDAQPPAGYSSGHQAAQNLAAPATPSPYEMAR